VGADLEEGHLDLLSALEKETLEQRRRRRRWQASGGCLLLPQPRAVTYGRLGRTRLAAWTWLEPPQPAAGHLLAARHRWPLVPPQPTPPGQSRRRRQDSKRKRIRSGKRKKVDWLPPHAGVPF
jgi:hypothetical protein